MFESLPPSGWPISSPLLALSKYCLTESHWGEKKVFVLLFLFCRVYGGDPDGCRTVSVPTAMASHLALIKEIQVEFAEAALLSCTKPSQ